MDIYSRKSRWKIVLFAIAAVIGLATLVYINYVYRKIEAEEAEKVQLWAEAVKRRAELVKYTNRLFDKLAEEERFKATIWASATELIVATEDSEILNFLITIVQNNKTIPVLIVDSDNRITNNRNVDFPGIEDSINFTGNLRRAFLANEPIPIYDGFHSQSIYYGESQLFSDLRSTLNEIIQSFISEVVINSASIPVILVNDNRQIVHYGGEIDTSFFRMENGTELLISEMVNSDEPVQIDLGEDEKLWLYYQNSYMLRQLRYFPFIQLGILAIFLIVSYVLFSTARRAEQNRVWVGMAKETAHQLGTPISSLTAWVEYMKEMGTPEGEDESMIAEIEKDVERLELVADRFSKIGAKPLLKPHRISEVIGKSFHYFERRSSDKASFVYEEEEPQMEFSVNAHLFDWVLENLLKNALDAMDGKGRVTVRALRYKGGTALEIEDTGKGINKAHLSQIFQPGFSTKKRGWGLGLSLTKRIIENYHKGKIFVKQTGPEGTVFRIELN